MADRQEMKIMETEPARLPLGMKLGYGVGDFAFNLGFQVCALYLIYFFTDIYMIPAAVAGSIFMVSKIWDAVCDPIVGLISDHTDSRWGQKRPFMLFGAIPLGIATFLLFFGPDLPGNLRIVYAYATFIIFSTVIAATSVPYGALTADMTLDAKERSSISGFRMTCALFGTLFAAAATKPLVSLFQNEATGFRWVGAIYGVIIAVIVLTSFASVRERIKHTKEKKLPFRENFQVIIANIPFLYLAGGVTLYMVAVNLLAIVVTYFFKYNLHRESLVPIAFIALFVTAAVFIPAFVWLSNKKSKKFAFNVGMVILGAALVGMFFVPKDNIYLIFALFFISGIGMSTVFLFPWAMVPDTVEYSEWKTGLRREGTIYGVYFLCFKFGSAISGFIAGIGLDFFGYVANVKQTANALLGIRLLISFVPLVFIILGMVLISFYSIDSAFHKKILAELEVRGK
jgi:GPH family glycoside/pentoside/hexuronide:cation symporter